MKLVQTFNISKSLTFGEKNIEETTVDILLE